MGKGNEVDEMENSMWLFISVGSAVLSMLILVFLTGGGSTPARKCNHPAAWIFYQHTPGKPQSKKCFRCGKTLP